LIVERRGAEGQATSAPVCSVVEEPNPGVDNLDSVLDGRCPYLVVASGTAGMCEITDSVQRGLVDVVAKGHMAI